MLKASSTAAAPKRVPRPAAPPASGCPCILSAIGTPFSRCKPHAGRTTDDWRTAGHRAGAVGVWAYEGGRAREVRPAVRWALGSPDPFSATRERFRNHLLDLDRGLLPAEVGWSGVVGEVRKASRGRGFAEWRLDELDPDRP